MTIFDMNIIIQLLGGTFGIPLKQYNTPDSYTTYTLGSWNLLQHWTKLNRHHPLVGYVL